MAAGSNALDISSMTPLEKAKWALDQAARTDDPKERTKFLMEASILSLQEVPEEEKSSLPRNVDRTIEVLREMKEGEDEETSAKRALIGRLALLEDRVAELRLGLIDGQLDVMRALERFESTGEGSIDEVMDKISTR